MLVGRGLQKQEEEVPMRWCLRHVLYQTRSVVLPQAVSYPTGENKAVDSEKTDLHHKKAFIALSCINT